MYARETIAEAALEAFHRVENLDPGKDIKRVIGQMSEAYEHQAHDAPIAASWAVYCPHLQQESKNACASSGQLFAAEYGDKSALRYCASGGR